MNRSEWNEAKMHCVLKKIIFSVYNLSTNPFEWILIDTRENFVVVDNIVKSFEQQATVVNRKSQ